MKISLKKGWALAVIGADEKLKPTYLVGDTSWEPTYELHASTLNGKPSSAVSLHYHMRIKQETEEDWSDTAQVDSQHHLVGRQRTFPFSDPPSATREFWERE